MSHTIHCTQKLLDCIKPSTIAPHGASSTGLGNRYVTALFCKPQVARLVNEKTLLTLKKISKRVLARCEGGHDDYSWNVAKLPMAAGWLGNSTGEGAP